MISADPAATIAEVSGEKLILVQPIERALSGEAVELVVDVQLAGVGAAGTVQFQIERGGLGSTTVQVIRVADGSPVVIETIEWGGSSDERNTFVFSVEAEDFEGAAPPAKAPPSR